MFVGVLSAACGGILDETVGLIQSPGYPGDYPNYSNCSWNLLFNSTQQLTLTFHYFETHGSGDSFKLFLKASSHQGEAFIDLYEMFGYCVNSSSVCPSRMHLSVLATEVIIQFKSDSIGTSPGFNISYDVTKPGTT